MREPKRAIQLEGQGTAIKRNILTHPALAVLAVLNLTSCATAQPANADSATPGKKPNIVFILVDNVGWGDFSCYGGTTPTPRIDKLASQGIRFNNYNVECQCTPSRSAILTGRMPVRSGTFTVPLPGQGASGLSPWEYTIAELLSDAGYATALYGKWHVGEESGRLPSDQGFDEWWGIKNSLDEAGYTSYPLFTESGMKPPMIWEGKKGQPSTPVMPLDLAVRPLVDEQYIIPKTVDFITLQRHFSAMTKFAHVESRFCGHRRRGKVAFDVPVNPCVRSACSRSVAVGLRPGRIPPMAMAGVCCRVRSMFGMRAKTGHSNYRPEK